MQAQLEEACRTALAITPATVLGRTRTAIAVVDNKCLHGHHHML